MRTPDVARDDEYLARGSHVLVRAAEHRGGGADDLVARMMARSAPATIASATGWIAMAGAQAWFAASIATLKVEVGGSARMHASFAPAPTSINSLLGKLVRPICRLAAPVVSTAV